jgi:uncharacterized protein (DUF2147 family)
MFRCARWYRLSYAATVLAAALMAGSASATPAASPLGTWTTANGHGVIAIAPCGDALCGRIVGIDRLPTEPMPTDVHGHSQCGLTIIKGEKPEADGTWLGEVTDPRDGTTYHAKLWLDADGNLNLRGFIGIPLLGSTETWRPFTGHLNAECGFGRMTNAG